jgi:hypothetical protein
MEIIARREMQAYAPGCRSVTRKRAYVSATSIAMALCLNRRGRRAMTVQFSDV